jgi:hypothetical protein
VRRIFWHELDVDLDWPDGSIKHCHVEATISASSRDDIEIEGVKVFTRHTRIEVVPSDHQFSEIERRVREEFEVPEKGDDWRNQG